MKMSRRKALKTSGAALAGLTLGAVNSGEALAQGEQAEGLTAANIRNTAPLPLNGDGSAVEYTPADVGSIEGRVIWRYGIDGNTPDIEHDFAKMKLNVNTRGTALSTGTVTASDLEKLKEHSYIVRIQCGAPLPSGIVKWTGVRFADFASLLGVQSTARYVRFVGSDNYYTEEHIDTMMHPQVVLAWKLNDELIPPEYGAPLRLVVPFEWAARSVKGLTDILFTATSFPHPEAPLNAG